MIFMIDYNWWEQERTHYGITSSAFILARNLEIIHPSYQLKGHDRIQVWEYRAMSLREQDGLE